MRRRGRGGKRIFRGDWMEQAGQNNFSFAKSRGAIILGAP